MDVVLMARMILLCVSDCITLVNRWYILYGRTTQTRSADWARPADLSRPMDAHKARQVHVHQRLANQPIQNTDSQYFIDTGREKSFTCERWFV